MSVVIKVENVSKQYRLGQVGTGSLSHDLNRLWYSIRGKEDPYLKIGEENDRTAKGESQYVWALKDINFEVEQGKVLGIIGRNGAGKSTLLKILSRTTTPTTGSIRVKGRIASLLEVGTGFHPELSGRDNIFLNGAILGMTKDEIKSKFDEIVDFAGVERYIDTPVKRYSSGMYVRLAFAVAAHLDPEILIVDEVLAVGDAEFQKKCLGKMKDVSVNDGRTVLFVSHNMSAIRNLCDEVLLMSRGTVESIGPTEDIINAYFKKNIIDLVLKDRTDRVGSGLIKFTNIVFLNAQNVPVENIFTGDYLKVEVYYEVNGEFDLKDLIAAVVFQDDYQKPVMMFVSDEMVVERLSHTENKITLEVNALPLRGGTYSVKLFSSHKTTAPTDFCDVIEDAGSINILSSDFWGVGRNVRNELSAVTPSKFIYY
ncbi:ABC transporter ATP-binding protein [Ferruginibacter lapsinanis]|uniref:ABC transporter ATP-binding protein n=1 Tax=Ferruginibacter lapsinanis TaxID=563172 RepID=UPI001E41A483|nr:ABC transporter ATP-binding protein [Ferruginibacter lapsinanis]UEG49474.1 ABC transporter ATP-binding protein [Ferruginibacter lapsinanis]